MNRITIYILRQVLLVTTSLVFVMCGVIWLTQSLRFVDWMVNRGLPLLTFLRVATLVMPNFLVVILPIGIFGAVLFAYHKLQADSELIVMRACGVSPWRLLTPGLIVAVIGTLTGYLLTLYVLPASYRQFKDLQATMRNDYAGVVIQQGVFSSLDSGLTLFVREQGPSGELLGIMIHDDRKENKPVTMTAERGAMVSTAGGPRILMENGNRQELDRHTGQVTFLFFDHYTLDIAPAAHDEEGGRQRIATERFLSELLAPDDVHDPQTRSLLRAEGHQRLVAPLLIPAFVMVALACLLSGGFSRRGQTVRIIVAAVIVLLIQALEIAAANLAAKHPPAIVIMYLTVFAPIGVALYWILTDSPPDFAAWAGRIVLRRPIQSPA